MEYIKTVCKIGQGEKCCRYLLLGAEGFYCGKHSSTAGVLNARVAAGTIIARGDNCSGFYEDVDLETQPVETKPLRT